MLKHDSELDLNQKHGHIRSSDFVTINHALLVSEIRPSEATNLLYFVQKSWGDYWEPCQLSFPFIHLCKMFYVLQMSFVLIFYTFGIPSFELEIKPKHFSERQKLKDNTLRRAFPLSVFKFFTDYHKHPTSTS